MDGSTRAVEREVQGEACLTSNQERPTLQSKIGKTNNGGKILHLILLTWPPHCIVLLGEYLFYDGKYFSSMA